MIAATMVFYVHPKIPLSMVGTQCTSPPWHAKPVADSGDPNQLSLSALTQGIWSGCMLTDPHKSAFAICWPQNRFCDSVESCSAINLHLQYSSKLLLQQWLALDPFKLPHSCHNPRGIPIGLCQRGRGLKPLSLWTCNGSPKCI
jgi:hypothetical protein